MRIAVFNIMRVIRLPLLFVSLVAAMLLIVTVIAFCMVNMEVRLIEQRWLHSDSGQMCRSSGNFSIPHILHQTFASEMVYENYKPFINSCLSLNPDWTYYLWRDSDAEALLSEHYPQYLSIYKGFQDNLQRSDAIRYVILHRFGGIYLDMDVKCLQPFHPTLTSHAAFLDQERVEQTRILGSQEFSAMNSLMGSVPGHSFFRLVSDRVLTRKLPGTAVYSTGPMILTSVFKWHQDRPAARSWPVTLLPPSVGSPLMDPRKDWKARCRYAVLKRSRPDSQLNWLDRGCRTLAAKRWRLDDTNSRTVAAHQFLHLGYEFAAHHRRPVVQHDSAIWLQGEVLQVQSDSSDFDRRLNSLTE